MSTEEFYSSRAAILTLRFPGVSVLSWVWHPCPVLLCLWTSDLRPFIYFPSNNLSSICSTLSFEGNIKEYEIQLQNFVTLSLFIFILQAYQNTSCTGLCCEDNKMINYWDVKNPWIAWLLHEFEEVYSVIVIVENSHNQQLWFVIMQFTFRYLFYIWLLILLYIIVRMRKKWRTQQCFIWCHNICL